MRKFGTAVIIVIAFLGSIVGLYLHGRAESEKENEAPISALSKLIEREGAIPILELSKENSEAAGIEAIPFSKDKGSLHISPNAVIRDDGRTWVYLKLDDIKYSRTEIEPLTQSEEGAWRIRGDVPQNTSIVTVGAQLLLSEELKSQVQVGEGVGN